MDVEWAPEAVGIGGPLAELLAGYLLTSRGFRLPGADGMTVAGAVATDYPAALASGYVPGPAELARRHPDRADAVAAFFGRCGSLPPGS